MLEAAGAALQNIATVQVAFFMALGVAVGLFVGLLPGLGGVTGMTLLLPFVFGMDPFAGISMLVGFAAVTNTSDTFPSVLIGVPGSGGSQATIMDGYPLSKRGEAARALGASFSASLLGGIFGAIALLGVITVARPFVGTLGNPELLMFTVLGLAIVGVLVRGDPVLGLVSALLGVAIATVGGAPATPEYRYVFGQLYLYSGLSIVVVALGLFAVPEVLSLLVKRTPISRVPSPKSAGLLQGFKETLRHKSLVARSSLIGVGIGAVPGLGGAVIDWIAYGVAKQTVKDNSQFGLGDIRGVIAPESANNAKEGGTLVPTLVLGIPGSSTTAVLLGGLILMGFNPGPEMVDQHLDLTLTVVWTLALANVLATAVCFALSRPISRITFVRGELLAPFLLVLFMGAAYQASNHMGDLAALAVIGLVGYLMKLASWPRAPAIIGFVLAPSLERYLHLSMSRFGLDWVRRPGVLVIGTLIVLVTFGGPMLRHWRARRGKRATRTEVDT